MDYQRCYQQSSCLVGGPKLAVLIATQRYEVGGREPVLQWFSGGVLQEKGLRHLDFRARITVVLRGTASDSLMSDLSHTSATLNDIAHVTLN